MINIIFIESSPYLRFALDIQITHGLDYQKLVVLDTNCTILMI